MLRCLGYCCGSTKFACLPCVSVVPDAAASRHARSGRRVLHFVMSTAAEINTWEILEELGFSVKQHLARNDADYPNTIYAQFSSLDLPKIRLDFALPSAKIAIEVQGDYWHSTDKSQKLTIVQAKVRLQDDYKRDLLHLRHWKLIIVHEKDVMGNRSRAKSHLESSIFDLILV